MVDLSKKYALLESGEIEPLQYEDGEPRNAYTYSKHFPTCYSFHVNGEEVTDVKYWMPIEPPKEGMK